ncbi:hypothetical protein GDO81_007975 [Engystomops pustulosus]|uniref:Uncharacterized protein n=1 Tax=Engystomops pustulosus TaxID=76066 RepID=A0AAV7CCX5_ENGPU|nr:hypothetical protein GDO81_007975 [Engystomops pustulosus]
MRGRPTNPLYAPVRQGPVRIRGNIFGGGIFRGVTGPLYVKSHVNIFAKIFVFFSHIAKFATTFFSVLHLIYHENLDVDF